MIATATRPAAARRLLLGLAALAGGWGCGNAGEDRVLRVEADAGVRGLVYFDVNGNRLLDVADAPLRGVRVRLLRRWARDTIATVVTGADGTYEIVGVRVGEYIVTLDSASIGDSVSVVRIEFGDTVVGEGEGDELRLVLSAGAVDTVVFAVSFPLLTVEEARAVAVGRKVFVEGVALNGARAFGDATVHLRGTAAAIRATRVLTTQIEQGDSVRVLGVRDTSAGQPVLDRATAALLALGRALDPELVRTGVAASADGGRLDAALVRVEGASVADTARAAEGFALTVNDGSGALTVLLDADVPFDTRSFVPGAVIDAVGVLVPTGTDWILKPRGRGDLTVR